MKAPLLQRSALALAGALLLVLAACSPTVTVHGYVPTDEELAEVQPGQDTVVTVAEKVGRPSSSGLLRDSDWYYVQTTMEQLAYNPQRPIDRKVVAIGFNEAGVVTDVQTYGLEDGRIVNLSPRVTQTGGQRVNILQRIFGGLLNFDAESVL